MAFNITGSEECIELATSLMMCYKENPFTKFFGVCTELDIQTTACLKKERLKKRKANQDNAKQMKGSRSEKIEQFENFKKVYESKIQR